MSHTSFAHAQTHVQIPLDPSTLLGPTMPSSRDQPSQTRKSQSV
jgi:hypothetical protein